MPYVQLRALRIVVVAHVQRSLTHRRTEGTLGQVSLLECDPQHTITRDLDASLFRRRAKTSTRRVACSSECQGPAAHPADRTPADAGAGRVAATGAPLNETGPVRPTPPSPSFNAAVATPAAGTLDAAELRRRTRPAGA